MRSDSERRSTAEIVAADLFGVAVEHITEAPQYCGDGIDGACLRGECEIVAAVDKLLAFAAQETTVLQTALREAEQTLEEHHGYYNCVAKVDADAAVRAQAEFWQREHDTLQRRVETLERTVDGLAERKYRPPLHGGETG